jgi:hypothetical protein
MKNPTEHSTFAVTIQHFFDPFGDGKSERKILYTKRYKVLADRAEIIKNLNDVNNNIRDYYTGFAYSVSKKETSLRGKAIQLDQLLFRV